MNKFFTIAGICCALPLIIIGVVWLASNKPQEQNAQIPSENLTPQGDATLSVGTPFPDFTLTEVDGRTITNETLKGKPAIIWFTTSWCTPCQIGAKAVSKLDDELGGNAFDVLVIFVDPRESDADLINWRKQFASDDWMVAFDNELTKLAKRINLKFLDSKFLLDKDGVVKNIDFKIADENYLNTIRQIVEEN
ncbi:MAG: TlpA disulfide reductase family protein [Patescibacteria group bacterium]